VNHAQWEGGTPLHDAARQGNVELVRFFVSHGANVNARSTHGAKGVTPAEDARDFGHTKLAAMLDKLAAAAATKNSSSNSSSVAVAVVTTDWAGEDLWYKCRGCHGMDGKGNTKVGVEHNIPDLTSPAWQSKTTDEEIRKVITNGSDKEPKMKAFGDMYSRKEIENLIAHIRSMKAK
jgi:cytochrome c553